MTDLFEYMIVQSESTKSLPFIQRMLLALNEKEERQGLSPLEYFAKRELEQLQESGP